MPSALFRPSSLRDTPRHGTSGRPRGLRRALPLVAVAAAVTVVASLAVVPQSARAAEASLTDSVARGTVEQDILSGRVTIDQLVDANIAARSSAQETAPMNRSELTRQATAEVQELREHGTVDAPDINAHTAASDGITASKFSFKKAFRKVKHFFSGTTTVNVPLWAGIAGSGATTTLGLAISAACAAGGVLWCAVASAAIFVAGAAVFVLLLECVRNQDKMWHVTLPQIQHSYCSK